MDLRDIKDKDAVLQTAISIVAKGSALLVLGQILAKVLGFMRQLLIIRLLSPEIYGLITIGFTILNFSVILGCLGLDQGSQRYIAFSYAKNELPKVKGTIHSSAKLASVSALTLMSLVLVFSKPISNFFSEPELMKVLFIIGPAIPLGIGITMVASYFLGFHRSWIRVGISDIGFNTLSVIFIIIALFIKRSLYAPVFAFTAASFVTFIVSLYFYRSSLPLKLKHINTSRIGRSLLLFSLPLFSAAFLSLIMGNLDTIMIGHFLPSDKVGFYNAAFLLMQFMPIFFGPLVIIYFPVATSLVAKETFQEVISLYQNVTKWMFTLTLPLFLMLFLFPSQVLTLFFGHSYSEAAIALRILVLGEFIHTFLGPNDQSLGAFGNTKLLLFGFMVATSVNIILNILLVPRIGISGAAFATAIALGVVNVINSSFLLIKYKLHPFTRKYLVPVFVTAVASAAMYFPLSKLVEKSNWWVISCYPVFLAVGLASIVVTKSISRDDLFLLEFIRDSVRKTVSHRSGKNNQKDRSKE